MKSPSTVVQNGYLMFFDLQFTLKLQYLEDMVIERGYLPKLYWYILAAIKKKIISAISSITISIFPCVIVMKFSLKFQVDLLFFQPEIRCPPWDLMGFKKFSLRM